MLDRLLYKFLTLMLELEVHGEFSVAFLDHVTKTSPELPRNTGLIATGKNMALCIDTED